MVNLEEWDKEEMKRTEEVISSLIDRVERGEEISLLDLAPEYREILREGTYGLWVPPGGIQKMLQRPLLNLASMLDRGMPVPSVLLVPLNLYRSKAGFIGEYGLVPEIGGPSYDIFLQEIREGRILPVITQAPTHYKGDFYQEILKACEEGIQQLPPSMLRITSFMGWFSLIESAIQEGIPLEEGWIDLVLQRHPEYNVESWKEKARSILSDERVRIIQKEYPELKDKEYVASIIGTYAYNLSIFGFSGLANLSLGLLRKSLLSFDVLNAYYEYLVSGYSVGLGGVRMYDRFDLEMMAFLRIIEKRDLPQEGEFVIVSPALFSVVGTTIKIPIVMKFDEDDLKNSLKRERDEELEKHMLDSIRAFQRYDFREFRERNEAINEIVTERIVKEARGYYRRSKIVKGIIISGGTLTLAAGAIEAYQYLQPLLGIIPGIPGIIPEAMIGMIFEEILKKIPKITEKREEMTRWLVSRWPFQQKGLPFHLWLHEIS
ncbi:hypothetical protein [Candidatus Methanodesulfokora washburnensis]|jgi:hypothetical protein|uniref:Uncharacterized protein n=1 Tax=Candidatus Methanodesulfokora washburnensis TaxID=2478471 RepID=A0A429GHV2_9CREN|nr:hypothetical protein [Candidatus Methanodesulfokores washburnensis]RSN73471.1 hypothetical protein D6D85_10295 [Candidatus Methanodesulfokores washburnensis]